MDNYNNIKNKIPFWIYTALVFITILNDKMSILNVFFSLVYVTICMYYAMRVVAKSRAALYIFLFPVAYIVFVIFSPDYRVDLNSKWGMLNWTLKVMLTFFPAYYYGRKGIVSYSNLRIIGICFFIIGIVSYYLNISLLYLNFNVDSDGVTNNVGYLFVAILPILFVNLKKNIVFIILTYILVFMCLKRGAIICSLLSLPYFYYLVRKNYHISKKTVVLVILFSFIAGAYLVRNAIQSNAYVEKRVEMTMEGNSSGRDDYIFKVIDVLENRFDVTDYVFGKGINYSGVILENYAHNDWFEILLSIGLIGCFFYFLTLIGIYIYAKKECNGTHKTIVYLILMIIFLRTLMSMNFFSMDALPLYFTLGLLCNSRSYVKNSSLYRHIQ